MNEKINKLDEYLIKDEVFSMDDKHVCIFILFF